MVGKGTDVNDKSSHSYRIYITFIYVFSCSSSYTIFHASLVPLAVVGSHSNGKRARDKFDFCCESLQVARYSDAHPWASRISNIPKLHFANRHAQGKGNNNVARPKVSRATCINGESLDLLFSAKLAILVQFFFFLYGGKKILLTSAS